MIDSSLNWQSKVPVATLSNYLKQRVSKAPVILIAEDDEDICSHLIFEFEQLGFKTLSAQNGLDALRIFDERGPEIDVILSDVRMPFKGGFSLVDAIGETESTPLFVLMTGYAYNMPAYEGRINAYFSKPINFTTLSNYVVEQLYLRDQGQVAA